MSTLNGSEPIIDGLLTELKARVPAILTSLAGTLTPVLTLPAVQEWHVGDVDYGEKWPIVMAIATDDDITHEKTGRIDVAHHIEIRFQVVGEKPEDLQRRTLRYTRAFLQALLDAETAGSFTAFTLSLNDKHIAYGEQKKNAQNALEREVRMSLDAWAAEEH